MSCNSSDMIGPWYQQYCLNDGISPIIDLCDYSILSRQNILRQSVTKAPRALIRYLKDENLQRLILVDRIIHDCANNSQLQPREASQARPVRERLFFA